MKKFVRFRDIFIGLSIAFPFIEFFLANTCTFLFSYLPIIIIDLYIILSLTVAALISDGIINYEKHMITRMLPKKFFGLLIFIFGYCSIMVSFANIYNVMKDSITNMQTPFDSFYFSFQVMTTMDNGEYKPNTESVKKLIIWEFGSALLLITGGFGLLLSRLANYKSPAANNVLPPYH